MFYCARRLFNAWKEGLVGCVPAARCYTLRMNGLDAAREVLGGSLSPERIDRAVRDPKATAALIRVQLAVGPNGFGLIVLLGRRSVAH